MTILSFVVLGLATLRMSYLLMAEEGPFNMFGVLRKILKVEAGGTNYFSKMFACLWCTSLNVSIVFVSAFLVWQVQTMFVATILAVSSLAILFDAAVS